MLITLSLPVHGYACGSIDMYLMKYWSPGITVAERIQLLEQQACSEHINYLPHTADPVIARVLANAIKSGLPHAPIQKLLKKYHCAYGARNVPEYITIRSFISEEKYAEFCNLDYLESIYIVKAVSGAILRAGPSTDTEELGAVREGDFVENLGEEDEWLHVKSIHYGKGYIHRSLLTSY